MPVFADDDVIVHGDAEPNSASCRMIFQPLMYGEKLRFK